MESGGWRVGSRSSHGERREGETFDGGAAGEEAVGAGEEAGGVARVAGEGGVEKEQVGRRAGMAGRDVGLIMIRAAAERSAQRAGEGVDGGGDGAGWRVWRLRQ